MIVPRRVYFLCDTAFDIFRTCFQESSVGFTRKTATWQLSELTDLLPTGGVNQEVCLKRCQRVRLSLFVFGGGGN